MVIDIPKKEAWNNDSFLNNVLNFQIVCDLFLTARRKCDFIEEKVFLIF